MRLIDKFIKDLRGGGWGMGGEKTKKGASSKERHIASVKNLLLAQAKVTHDCAVDQTTRQSELR